MSRMGGRWPGCVRPVLGHAAPRCATFQMVVGGRRPRMIGVPHPDA